MGLSMTRRFADGVEHHEVVLAAGGHAVDDDVRDRHVGRGERLLGLGLLDLGGLDLLGEFLGLRPAAPAARPATPCRPSCWPSSVRRAGCRPPRSRRGARRRLRAARRRGRDPHPRARCDARTASGSSRSSLRSITGATLLVDTPGQHNHITLQLHHLSQHLDTPVTMEPMLEAPDRRGTTRRRAAAPTHAPSAAWWHSLHAASTRRALLLTALGGLLIAGLITALPQADAASGLTASTISPRPARQRRRSTTPRAATA